MPQIINTNIASLNAQRNLDRSQAAGQTAMERLSSGLRINSAKDDAAGLAISTRFQSQISGLNVAQRNANDGISYAQTAEGALGEATSALQRIRDLAIQSANDTNSASDRQALNQEVNALVAEINRIAESTQFNGGNVLDGSQADISFQVGANRGQTIEVSGVDARGEQLGARVSTSASIESAEFPPGDLSINGYDVTLDEVTDSKSLAAAVNAIQADTGIEATTARSVKSSDVSGSIADGDGPFTLNEVEIQAGTTSADSIANINAMSDKTGVTATEGATAGEIILSNESGDEIVLTATANATGGDLTFHPGIELAGPVADGEFAVVTDLATVETTAGGLGQTQVDQDIDGLNILTREGANRAIQTVDFALDQINGIRAELGAVQSRFESTIANLATTSENLSAANSRIMDADFAKETAELSRTQVLQQAGLSMLGQANAQPQQVLKLLQG